MLNGRNAKRLTAINDMFSMLKQQQEGEVKKNDYCKDELQENEMDDDLNATKVFNGLCWPPVFNWMLSPRGRRRPMICSTR